MAASCSSTAEFVREAHELASKAYVLQLFIAGPSPRSQRAVSNVRRICQTGTLKNTCELQVIDIFQQPLLAKLEQIVAVPALVRKLPAPKQLFVGDMSNIETIVAKLLVDVN